MNAFSSNLEFEQAYTNSVVMAFSDYLNKHKHFLIRQGRLGEADKSGLDKSFQREIGDFQIVDQKTRKIIANIDLKVERSSKYPNVYFEEYSNFSFDPAFCKLGWAMTLQADYVWYSFADSSVLARLHMKEFRYWMNEMIPVEKSRNGRPPRKLPRGMTFPQKLQTTHKQMNKTVGRIVPFDQLPPEVWGASFYIDTSGDTPVARKISRDEFLERLTRAGREARDAETKKSYPHDAA